MLLQLGNRAITMKRCSENEYIQKYPELHFCPRTANLSLFDSFPVDSERWMLCAIEYVMTVQGHPRSLTSVTVESARRPIMQLATSKQSVSYTHLTLPTILRV